MIFEFTYMTVLNNMPHLWTWPYRNTSPFTDVVYNSALEVVYVSLLERSISPKFYFMAIEIANINSWRIN